MTPELDRRLTRLKMAALQNMREQTGPCHLAAWWQNFINNIPQDAAFDDLDQDIQQLILVWEEKLSDESEGN